MDANAIIILLIQLFHWSEAPYVLRQGRWQKVTVAHGSVAKIKKEAYSERFRAWWNKATENYDSSLRPNYGGNAVKVRVAMNVIGVSSIDEAQMRFTLELLYHEFWLDERLKFNRTWFGNRNPIDLPSDAIGRLWIPDTCFSNALDSKVPDERSVSHKEHVKLYDDGTLFYSRRYPFDQQACGLELSSYGYTLHDVLYDWDIKANQIRVDEINLPDFYAKSYLFSIRNESNVGGEYNIAKFCIILKRRSGFCFLNLFIPATAVVTSSWISLWMEDETQFSDMFAVILAIIFLSFSFNSVMPKVSYIKVMDLYLGACFIFAFLSLAKLIVVKLLHKQIKKRKRSSVGNILTGQANNQPLTTKNAVDSTEPTHRPFLDLEAMIRFSLFHPFLRRTTHDCFWKGAKIFHVGSQVILPVAFATFGFFYFAIFSNVNMSNTTC